MTQRATVENLWFNVKEEFKSLFQRDVFDAWFADLCCLEAVDGTMVLGVPNDFAEIWIKDNYIDLIEEKLNLVADRPYEVVLKVVDHGQQEETRQLSSSTRRDLGNKGTGSNDRRPSKLGKKKARPPLLNPRNTFENFIVGSGNQLAHAASMAVAKAPAKAYNPLFLYGDTGLGKTHLLQAIAHTILDQNPDSRVVYVSCEKFTNEFIRAIQENTIINFRKFYRNIELLLIDDIHFLAGKERIQEEFFHTFNDLFEVQRQICLTSDRPASEISKLENRLLSRFQWGMVTDIQAPDLETRQAILSKKANGMNFNISDEILQFLAQRITSNVRRLEGALIKVASYGTLMNQPLNIEIVEKLLHYTFQEEVQNQISIEKIQKKVVEFFQLRPADMTTRRRPSNIAFPRQIAMYLSRNMTNHSLQEIGESFGGRDHGTVIHACKTVVNMMEQDDTVKRNVDYLTKQLTTNTP